ncbi:hypothetical protein R0K17_23290, partial [Planococcus sp. SIMBA_143]
SMMKEIKIYIDTVPEANKLQTNIDDLNKILSQDTFDEKLEGKLSLLKREISNKLKGFDQLQNATLKAFLSKQYTAQMNNLEKEFKNYMGA